MSPEKLRAFQEKARLDQFGLNVGGLSLNASYAVHLIALVTAGLAFLMLGPLVALKKPGPLSSDWTFTYPTARNRVMEVACIAVTFLWAIFPIGAILDLLEQGAISSLVWIAVSAATALFSTIVFCRVAMVLRSIRTRDPDA